MVVGASILLIVVDVGIEVWKVAVQVHSICVVPANQIPRNAWALRGEMERREMKFSD